MAFSVMPMAPAARTETALGHWPPLAPPWRTALKTLPAATTPHCPPPLLMAAPADPEPRAAVAINTGNCGWFESSWELQQGLAVSELPDRDGSVAALWFTRLDCSAARLQ